MREHEGVTALLCTSKRMANCKKKNTYTNDTTLQWRHNERDSVSNHQPHDCLLNRLFKAKIKEISKLRVTGLCEGNSPETGEFPAQRASNAENVSIWWRHHDTSFSFWWVSTGYPIFPQPLSSVGFSVVDTTGFPPNLQGRDMSPPLSVTTRKSTTHA